jgi:hypothetical protein
MAAIELYHQDGHSAGIYYCSECKIVARTKEEAEHCHGERLCISCGKQFKRYGYYKLCEECEHKEWTEKEQKKEQERFEQATKITEDEYTGDHVYCGDDYYESVEYAVDQFLPGQEPEYVWACKPTRLPRVDLEDVTSNLLDNMWDDADINDLNGVEELETALEAFNKANEDLPMREPDYSTAILVNPRKEEEN